MTALSSGFLRIVCCMLGCSRLKERELHPVGIFQPCVAMSPGSYNRRVYEARTLGEKTVHRSLQIGHFECEADWPAGTASHFDEIDLLGVRFVEDFERRLSHLNQQGPVAVTGPELCGLKPEAVAIEASQALEIRSGDGDS